MLTKLLTRVDGALNAITVEVQAHITRGLPAFNIVGLPTTSVKESKERVRSAIISSNFKFPAGRITINLTPASIPKTGGRYDLAIALCILIASKQIKPTLNINNFELYGELNLNGSLAKIDGIFPAILQAKKHNKTAIIPYDYDNNLGLIAGIKILRAKHLLDVVNFYQNNAVLPQVTVEKKLAPPNNKDFNEVKGQMLAKRALEIATTGGHNLLFLGPPGAGKTMLIERVNTISNELSLNELLELGSIYSLANINLDLTNKTKIIRSPHHSSSNVAIIGGGTNPKPGEVSLAHNGILFLDELPEFNKNVLEVLREPLESGVVNISRAKAQVSYPANFQLLATMNPCPCGYFGDSSNRCHCTSEQITKYQNKISGPLLDRIDIKISVTPVDKKDLLNDDAIIEPSATIKQRVIKAYNKQIVRQNKVNANLNNTEIKRYIKLSLKQKEIIAKAIDKFKLSARSYTKILKVTKTIADLDDANIITEQHLQEAIGFLRI